MTAAYYWRPIPNRVDVICPECSSNAIFEFAVLVKIKQKKDIEYFQRSKTFEYREFSDSNGHRWRGAVFYHGFHTLECVDDLPCDYSIEDFKHRGLFNAFPNFDFGCKICTHCMLRRKSALDWPKDAFYQCDFKGKSLWAFNRESLTELRDFISSDARQVNNYVYSSFLLHIPSLFLDRKNRESIVKKLDKLF